MNLSRLCSNEHRAPIVLCAPGQLSGEQFHSDIDVMARQKRAVLRMSAGFCGAAPHRIAGAFVRKQALIRTPPLAGFFLQFFRRAWEYVQL